MDSGKQHTEILEMNRSKKDSQKSGILRFGVLLWLVMPCLLIAVYVFPFDFNGLTDMPNHLARADIMRQCFFGTHHDLCNDYVVRFIPVPFFLADLSLVACLSVLEPFMAEKVAIFTLLCFFTISWYLLYLRVNGSINVGYLAGLSLVISNYLHAGFYPFLLSVAMTLLWLYFWWPIRDSKTVRNQVLLGLSMTLIFACHLAGFLFVLVIYVAYDFYKVLTQKRKLRFLSLSFLKGGPILLAFMGLSVYQLFVKYSAVHSIATKHSKTISVLYYKPLLGKIVTLLYPFINYSRYLDLAMFVLLIAILACAVDFPRIRALLSSFWVFISLVFFVMFALNPTAIGGLFDIDSRYLLVGYLAAFIALGSVAKPRRLLHLAMSIILLFGFSEALLYKHEMNSELTKLMGVISQCDRGKTLVGINSIERYPIISKSRVNPFPHFASYYVLKGGSWVPGLFSPAYFHSNKDQYFKGDPQFHSYKLHGFTDLKRENLMTIRKTFDYVLITGFESEQQIRQYFPPDAFSLIKKTNWIHLLAARR